MVTSTSTMAKEARRTALQASILRLKNRGERVTITSVARAAGVTPALIHNTYPDVAEEVRAIQGKSLRAQRDEVRVELDALREANLTLRKERDEALADASRLASLNEALRFELAKAQAVAGGTVAPIQRKGPASSVA